MKVATLQQYLRSLAGPLQAAGAAAKVTTDLEQTCQALEPFKDQDFPSGFDSPRGWDLSKKITAIFKGKDEFKVKNLKNVLDKLFQDGDADPAKLTVKQVATLTKADYVITGTITHWQVRDDDVYSPDLLRGSSTLSITIYETAKATALRLGDKADPDEIVAGHGINAIEERPVTAIFPQEFGMVSCDG